MVNKRVCGQIRRFQRLRRKLTRLKLCAHNLWGCESPEDPATSSFPRPESTVGCAVCGKVKELDARGYPLDAGSTVRARCGHHFCSECLLERVSGCAPHEYRCEHVGCGQHVADFAIRRNSGTEPFTTECAWGRKFVGTQATPLEVVTASKSITPWGAHRLLSLPPALLGHAWPAERGVMGLRVCKQIRTDLMVHCSRIDLVQRRGAELCLRCCAEDFRRWPQHVKVTMRREKIRCGGRQLVRVMGECKGLARLDLRSTCIDVGSLGGVLGKCKGLAHLDLHENGIESTEAGWLAVALGGCKALAHLDLSVNRFGAEGARSLAGVLRGCTSLFHLDLCETVVGDEGARSLAGVLGECKALGHLKLSANHIGDEGAGSLAGVLGGARRWRILT